LARWIEGPGCAGGWIATPAVSFALPEGLEANIPGVSAAAHLLGFTRLGQGDALETGSEPYDEIGGLGLRRLLGPLSALWMRHRPSREGAGQPAMPLLWGERLLAPLLADFFAARQRT